MQTACGIQAPEDGGTAEDQVRSSAGDGRAGRDTVRAYRGDHRVPPEQGTAGVVDRSTPRSRLIAVGTDLPVINRRGRRGPQPTRSASEDGPARQTTIARCRGWCRAGTRGAGP